MCHRGQGQPHPKLRQRPQGQLGSCGEPFTRRAQVPTMAFSHSSVAMRETDILRGSTCPADSLQNSQHPLRLSDKILQHINIMKPGLFLPFSWGTCSKSGFSAWYCFPVASIHHSENQGVGIGVAPLLPLVSFLFVCFFAVNSGSVDPEVLGPTERILSPEDRKIWFH